MEQLPLLSRPPSQAELQIQLDEKIRDELVRLMAAAVEAVYQVPKGASDGRKKS